MGSDPDELGVSTSLDRHRDLSSGREAAVGARRLPGAQRRGADPPCLSRQRSVQSVDALVAAEPTAGLGSANADDHRRSLSCCKIRDLGAYDRLGCRQAYGRSLVRYRYQGSPCLFLTLQNFSNNGEPIRFNAYRLFLLIATCNNPFPFSLSALYTPG